MRVPRWLLGALAMVSIGCASRVEPASIEPAREAPRVTSNILRGDYVGSQACRTCHASIYQAWQGSPMRNMTRAVEPASVMAPFAGEIFQLGDDTVTMDTREGARFMRVVSSYQGDRLYRITKVIGGRHREDFAAVDVTGVDDPVRARGRGAERIMPASFVFATGTWRYKGYSVMNPERPELRVKVVWRQRCIGCHNTLPYFSYLFDDLLGGGSYQGSFSDDLLPAARTWRLVMTDRPALDQALAAEIEHLGGQPPPAEERTTRGLLAQAIRDTRAGLLEHHLVEVGIGCESCHGGAAGHVANPELLPSFEPRSTMLRVAPASGAAAGSAAWINRSCARCHTVLFTGYEWTWEGGRRDDPVPGGSSINSGEGRDFLLGGCADRLACTTCHDPHAADAPEALAALAGPTGNAVCAGCHPALATPEGLLAHGHHPPGAGSSCVGCHMPRKNMGLGYELTRYHRIGSPTDEARVLGDRPLECALCHTDQSVEEIVSTMERWWGKRYDRDRLRALYGDDLAVNALAATLARGKPHEEAAAIGALGERPIPGVVPAIAAQLVNEIPLVRFFARHALEQITGAPVPVDLDRPGPEIEAAMRRWLDVR